MNSEDSFKILEESVSLLEQSVTQFNATMPQPRFTQVHGGQYRYDDPDHRVFALLRCVRLASGFRAALLLIREGHCQETGVILRTLVEFCHDLDLVFAPLVDEESAHLAERKVEEYFSDETRPVENLLADTKKPPSMPRRKVYGAIGRSLAPHDPHRYRQISRVLEDVYSGYVHGNYPHTMELYNGRAQQFETSGVPARIDEWLTSIALVVHPTLNNFAMLALDLGLSQLDARLISQRQKLEQSEVCKRT